MNRELIKKDTRLFLFQALEHGLKTGRMDDAFLGKCQKEGMEMSFVFAKRYYNLIYGACLRHASHCVLGIVNLGLIEASEGLLHDAVVLLLRNGFVGGFREGWSRILKLVQYAGAADTSHRKTAFEWEKDFAESLSAEPGKPWVGYDEYQYHMLLYCRVGR